MTDIVIGFKSGNTITLTCDNCTVDRDNFKNTITHIEWEGATNINLMFVDLSEIEYVYQVLKRSEDK